MTDIADLEKRITGALDRIGAGLDAMAATDGAGDVAALQESLDAERTANSQLQERVSAIKEKQESLVTELEADVARLHAEMADHDGEVQNLKTMNDQLRTNNRALRDANQEGVGDAGLINDGMVAELDALRLSRDTDRKELDAILLDLKPLLEERANA